MVPKILVVDDSETDRTVLRHALEDDGYDVSVAASGEEALAKIRVSCPDVVLLESEMPETSGIDVLLALKSKAATRDVSVIMVTSNDRDDKVVGAFEIGATDFIAKPFSESVVRARVRNVIRIRSQHNRVEAAADARLPDDVSHETRNPITSTLGFTDPPSSEDPGGRHVEAIQEILSSRRKRVKATTEAKAQFLAIMSHEIRTPMTAILGFADLLSSEDQIENARADHLEAIRAIKRNGEYLLKVINDVLDLSKIEAGQLKVERIRCSALEVVADVVSSIRAKDDAKGLFVEVECDGPIPETVHTDPTRLRQILLNVIGNAVKFTEAGGVRVVMRLVRNSQDQPMLEVEVVDTGIGMSPKQIDHVFRPLSLAETYTTRKYGGAGLGLTTSKQLAELLEGTISVRSDPQRGSTFTVTVATGSLEGVALLQNLTEARFAARRTEHQAALNRKVLHCRVLLAEDGPDNQRLISFLLSKAGAEVTVAENGQVAVDLVSAAKARNESYDVILMDMQMPVMDGYSATKRLRAEGYEGPIVALTAHAMHGDRKQCLDSGCDDYMTKPIDRENLAAMVGRHVRTRQPAG